MKKCFFIISIVQDAADIMSCLSIDQLCIALKECYVISRRHVLCNDHRRLLNIYHVITNSQKVHKFSTQKSNKSGISEPMYNYHVQNISYCFLNFFSRIDDVISYTIESFFIFWNSTLRIWRDKTVWTICDSNFHGIYLISINCTYIDLYWESFSTTMRYTQCITLS